MEEEREKHKFEKREKIREIISIFALTPYKKKYVRGRGKELENRRLEAMDESFSIEYKFAE